MTHNVIYAGPADGKEHKPLLVEGVVIDPGIDPGSLVEIKSDGTGIRIDFKDDNDFGFPIVVADKNQAQSKPVGDEWIVGENMVAILPRSGEFINIFTIIGSGVAKGDALSRDSNAVLKKAGTDGSEYIVAYADEIQLSSFSLLRVRIA